MLLDCRAHDSEIQAHAGWSAGRVRSYLGALGRDTVLHDVWPTTPEGIRADLGALAQEHGARPIGKKTTLAGVMARMVDRGWWTRNLRRATRRENEQQEHAAGHITKALQCYVTDHAVKLSNARNKANRATLDALEVCNESGQAFNLQEIADKSVSNPALRRAELMTRCRGFEEAAQFMGHKGLFLTLTTPKRFHRKDKYGHDVKKWTDASPKDGQAYLCKAWGRIRAAWKKAGIAPYGFRVAEPHQDGTPHWHLLLFVPSEQVREMLAIAARHAMADSRSESGARQHRFTVKRIDPSRGSATGYIAKYIAKNIDGTREDGTQIDIAGQDDDAPAAADLAAVRVRAWAATWGIRQFQQIGGPSVTVWRELRRLGEDAPALQLEMFEKPRAAASRGAWFDFWMVQGGPEVARQDLTLRPMYASDSLGKYGDETKKIKGVLGFDGVNEFAEVTRLEVWTVQRAGTAAANVMQSDFELKRSRAPFFKAYEDAEFKRIGAAERTRTGVNNCTAQTFDFSSFDKSDPEETAYLFDRGDMGDPMTQADDIKDDEKSIRAMAWSFWPHVAPPDGATLDPIYQKFTAAPGRMPANKPKKEKRYEDRKQ